ncbi:GNAT family N-acetyltransferase [Streptomyces cocklensis]|jgi:ribosomal-protein-alanine N-acetyltransferase|uniref:Alanine acetyltransferase n=1 Tax=Actinacidiphila cocklensis TaxID=887465 RepID=A0A9W4DGJ9_9ACTN|nr:GNAT family protein [Actinacidiphila cocklensis]MDD1063633.1 GNAT family N-acetyltransferase [Actinacidiphila cocklensis]WSX73011.1 GNAT family N-acetyltransferase [Streptomyces sp. NBC_00899]WSX80923.1 GNAT family N-acetyltransferase [Streptomyces sp. NBC_00899]CAG6390944.1 Alanine acetyltransferase [Actinacidiphila cocklensis]
MRSSTRIRLIEPADAAPIAAHRVRDVEAFRRWEPEQPADFFTPEGQAERIDRMLAGHRAGTVWPGVVLAGDQVIGQVTVGGILPQPHLRRASLGYWIGSVAQNRGHAGQAVGLALRLMTDELGLHRVEASTNLENLPSQRVLRRNGFSPYGVAHSSIFLDGGWRDGLLWERILGD